MRTLDYYRGLEENLRALLAKLRIMLNSAETNQINEFLDAGEYGIALEILCSALHEENKIVSAEALKDISKLAEQMELDSGIWTNLAHE